MGLLYMKGGVGGWGKGGEEGVEGEGRRDGGGGVGRERGGEIIYFWKGRN